MPKPFRLTENRTKVLVALLTAIAAAFGIWKLASDTNTTRGDHSPIVNRNTGTVTIK
jgi:hypothetical protein